MAKLLDSVPPLVNIIFCGVQFIREAICSRACITARLGLADEAAVVEDAVEAVLAAGHRTADLAEPGQPTLGTEVMGDLVVAALET